MSSRLAEVPSSVSSKKERRDAGFSAAFFGAAWEGFGFSVFFCSGYVFLPAFAGELSANGRGVEISS